MTDFTPSAAETSPAETRTARSLGAHLIPLRRNWGWLMGAGIALIALGLFGLAAANLFTVVSALSFGAMMLVGGGVLLADSFRREGWQSRLAMIAISLLYMATGALVFYNPLQAVVALTLLCGAMLVAVGMLRIVTAFQMRPLAVWGWVLASGMISLLLGLFIFVQLPQAAPWVLGTFLAIELIFQGWSYVFLAMAIRSTFDGVQPRPVA
ncbi:MAG: HdeD family acid-resistance protein [Phreatobacter sp.]|uniref:HdeD family acid-resistance protein n=1 Tax=Phreatobacter sp. TaxID=1966341 RepID=UPI0027352830|nr:HdeD family acid-resistance protein [Phreatobacter sp.]MDP2802944.1 HdeD family acid-resistance protein [Phreatobacter sp.]